MTKKKQSPADNKENILIDNITLKIESSHVTALETINSSILRLFWEAGKLLDKYFLQGTSVDSSNQVKHITDILSKQFGDYFTYDNLVLMSKFSRYCSEVTMQRISSFISWDYLPKFLVLRDDESWIFYARLAYQESLTPMQLEERISSNLYQQTGLHLKHPEYPFLDLIPIKYNSIVMRSIKSYVDGENSVKFRELFAPLDFQLAIDATYFDGYVEVLKAISDKIVGLQNLYNNLLNIRFSCLFWDIGEEITRLFSLFTYSEQQAMNLLIETLQAKYNYHFDAAEIDAAISFSHQYSDRKYLNELVSLVTWAHIKILLQLDDRPTQIHFARQCHAERLTPGELQALLATGNNLKSTALSTDNHDLQEHHRSFSSDPKKTGNKTVYAEFREIDDSAFSAYDLNGNIFKNEDLMKFLKGV
jgi:hypothetical protein